jgi:hypothetical protein
MLGPVCGLTSVTLAVPYASSVRNTSGNTWEFVLNESAENVTVLRNGGNAVDLGALAPGRHTFDMTGFSDWDIKVTQQTPVAPWTEISNAANAFTWFEQGNGLAVNSDPLSEHFGVVYVLNPRTTQVTAPGTRDMGEGVYSLTADLQGVDLSTAAWTVPDPNDTSQAKAPGWSTDPGQPLNPWRMTLDGGGNLIVSDWTDLYGGIKYASPDLTTGGLVLATENGDTGGTPGQGGPLHGSIVSVPMVTGTLENDLTVWAMDEDLAYDGTEPPTDTGEGNSIWRWDVGSSTGYDVAPTLVVNVDNIPKTTDNRFNFMSNNTGILANAIYSPEHNKFYLTERRDDGNQAGLIVVTPDGVNGNSPTLEWSSLQFSIDNNLDGHNTLTNGDSGGTTGCSDNGGTSSQGSCQIQDIFRRTGGGMVLSPDGTKLYLHFTGLFANNTHLGTDSANDGAVVIIPLDDNGVPAISPDLSNLMSIDTTGNDANAQRREVVLDAAGNVYTTNNNVELLQVFSPGGATVATTSSDGTFTVVPFSEGTLGDHDGDDDVDAADYVAWRKLPSMFGDAQGYTDWRAHFGEGTDPGASNRGGVPEPSSLAFLVLAVSGLAIHRRDR